MKIIDREGRGAQTCFEFDFGSSLGSCSSYLSSSSSCCTGFELGFKDKSLPGGRVGFELGCELNTGWFEFEWGSYWKRAFDDDSSRDETFCLDPCHHRQFKI